MFSAIALRIHLRNAGGALAAEELAVDLQQVGPLVGPVLDVVLAADELVDQLVALARAVALVGEEGADLRPPSAAGR